MTALCPACGQQNREGRRFCAQCGAPLAEVPACLACGAVNQPGERFCGGCGARLAPGADAASAWPVPSAEPGEGERKQLTVLFADVQGSMDLQQDMGPEAWAQIMGRLAGILAEGVRRFGGTVDKFTGDGIMALFGAPVAQDDHARRACRAALYLAKAITAYAGQLRSAQGVNLGVRLGLNSGEVIVGRVGEDLALDPTALGHTVGLAQRMEAIAEPGTTYLTEHTARLVEGWFRLREVGPTQVKGARAPVRVFVLEGPPVSPSALRSGTALGTAPLVGRERELAVLEDALAGAAQGQAQVVGVVGQAGVGKSRLCEEFARSAAARGITVRRSSGVSHGREVPLLPVLALLRNYFGVTEADDPARAREKVTRRVLGLDPALGEDLPLLLDFLEVPDPARPAPPLAPEARMRRIFATVRQLIKRRSEQEVLVMLVEDLHWFDPQSEAFLERLIESYPGSRTLVLANFRPEFSARWMRHSYYRQLPLAALGDTAVGELLTGLLGADPSLAALRGFVQERTGGNPFFVEEVLRALLQDGTLEGSPGHFRLTRPLREVQAPASVQAVLAARIDRLPAGQKSILQTAAVIGPSFNPAVLAVASRSTDAALEDALSALCAAELLQETGQHPVREFRFWHPLTQEVAYSSLLSERRGRLHVAVAEALAAQEADRLDELSAVLAWHWEQAGRYLEAARWNMRAASWALRSDLDAARRRWQTAVSLLAKTDQTPEVLALGLQARMRLMQFGARAGIALQDSEQLFAEARALAERLGDTRLLTTTMFMSGTPMFMAGAFERARQRWWVEATGLADATSDPALTVLAGFSFGFLSPYTGRLAEALQRVDRALAACGGDAERWIDLVGYSPLARLHQFRSCLLARAGRLGEAGAALERCLTLARPRAEPETLAWALALSPHLAWLTGESDDTVALASEAVQISEDTGNVAALALALESLALAHLTQGRADSAAAACERVLAHARQHRSARFLQASVLAHLARARLAAGNHNGAAAVATEAAELAHRQEGQVIECLALLTRAQIGRAIGWDHDTVAADLDTALILVNETGARTYEPFIEEQAARLRDDEAGLREALRLFAAIGAGGHARRLQAEPSTAKPGYPRPPSA